MKVITLGVGVLALLASGPRARAQDLLVPAGTLLQCTMDEPKFSSATASVGDPVLCHLKSFQEFGRTVFPRGTMLAGHLEADKEPGHFVGKGYLKLTFDRVILPSGDLPLPAKVIAARGFKVDKEGDIKGKGHATRDVVEWMLPPLWAWKVIKLPARGPRPTLKGEEPMQLRLMDDIVVPKGLSAQYRHPDRPPYASSSSARPSGFSGAQPRDITRQAFADPAARESLVTASLAQKAVTNESADRVTVLVLTSNEVIEVTRYKMDGGLLTYRAVDGTEGSVDAAQLDWLKTTQLTSAVRASDRPLMTRQLN